MREVKPTQEPVPSSNIKDLFFNSGLLDIWATSLEPKYIDRFGNCHLTAAGMEWLFKELVEKFKVDMNIAIVAAGYITIDSFQQGADLPSNELTQRNHVLRDEATGEYYRWDGDLPKQVLAGSTPQSTGGIGKGAWVSVGDASKYQDVVIYNATSDDDSNGIISADEDAISSDKPMKIIGITNIKTPVTIRSKIRDTDSQIFTIDSMVTIDNGQPVRPEWFGDVEGAVDKAIHCLPESGGIVLLKNKRYKKNGYIWGFSAGTGKYMNKDNILIQGEKMPQPSSNYDRLVDGSVIEGAFITFANNVEYRDLGIDNGKYVQDRDYPDGVPKGAGDAFFASYPNVTERDAQKLKRNLKIHNVIGLCRDPESLYHSFIVAEAHYDVTCTGLVRAIYGVHGTVIKGKNVTVEKIVNELNGRNGLIIRSDTQQPARSENINIGTVFSFANGALGSTPHTTNTSGEFGVCFMPTAGAINDVHIGNVVSIGFRDGAGYTGGYHILKCRIDKLTADGFGSSSTIKTGFTAYPGGDKGQQQLDIGSLHAVNVNQAIKGRTPQNLTLNIDALSMLNVSDVAVDIDTGNRVTISKAHHSYPVNGLWRLRSTGSKLKVGAVINDVDTVMPKEFADDSTQLVLPNGWIDYDSNVQKFEYRLRNFGLEINGLIKTNGVLTSNIAALIPLQLRPKSTIRTPCVRRKFDGAASVGTLTFTTNGEVRVDEFDGDPVNYTFLSLESFINY